MFTAQRGHTAQRRHSGLGARFVALAFGGILTATAVSTVVAGSASAATTPPDYTIVVADQLGAYPIDNATRTLGAPAAGVTANVGVAISPNAKTAYVLQSGSLTPVTLSSGAAGAPIAVGPSATAVAISPNGSLAYVTDGGGNVTPVPLPGGPAGSPIALTTPNNTGVAFTPDGQFAYVVGNDAQQTTSFVTPINVATGQALTPIAIGNLARSGIKISPDGKTAYLPAPNKTVVYSIDLTTNTVGPQIQLGNSAFALALAISPDGKTLYAATDVGVVPVRLASGSIGATIALPAGFRPWDIAITPDGRTLYVSHRHADQFVNPPAEVVPIDIASGVVGTPIVTSTTNVTLQGALAITPDQAPVAAVTARATCLRAFFDASGSTVRYGSIVRYAWKFGDGKSAVTTGPKVKHTYAHAGSYTVTVTETDSAGTSTKRVFTGQTLLLNGGPSAVARVSVSAAECAATTVPDAVSPPAPGLTADGSDAGDLAWTGAQTRAELGLAALLVMVGTGLMTLARRRT